VKNLLPVETEPGYAATDEDLPEIFWPETDADREWREFMDVTANPGAPKEMHLTM
jgi:hypothetical protein